MSAPGAPVFNTIAGLNVAHQWAVSVTAPSNGGSAITGYTQKTYRASDNALLGTQALGSALVPTSAYTPAATSGVPYYIKWTATNADGTGPESGPSDVLVSWGYTGAEQAWTLPAGIPATIAVDLRGATGANSGGIGARLRATLAVTAGEVLRFYLGQSGGDGSVTGTNPAFNGGGAGAGHAGGGATDVRQGGATLAHRVLVAGGGGGSGYLGSGGAGGGTTGGNGTTISTPTPGLGGTPSAGGTAGTGPQGNGVAGSLGTGGAGALTTADVHGVGHAGGGGGGYYGGGGGGTLFVSETTYHGGPAEYNGGAGGGGGSSFAGTGTSGVTHTAGGANDSYGVAYVIYPQPGASPSARLKVWSGSAWATKPTKVWNGSAWVEKPVKVWSGSAWVDA